MNFMSTNIAIGFSQVPNASDAATQACLAAKNQINNKNVDFVLVLACPSHIHPDILNVVHTVLKPSKVIGCSTAGIILSEGTYNRGIAVLAITSKEITFGITNTTPNAPTDMRQAGVDWGHRITADAQSQHHDGCLIFADHLNALNASFILGIQEVLGNSSPLAGAIASDDFKFQKTSLMYQKQILNQGILGLLICATKVSIGNAHGFKPLGKPRTITRAENNVIMQIDGQPAINIYKEYLGKEAEVLNRNPFSMHSILYPLGIYIEEQNKYLVKNAIDLNLEGSIVVTGPVPQGAEVHLMIGNKDSCRRSTMDAAAIVKESLGGRQAKLILVIESAGRQKIFKNNASVEIIAIKEILGYTTPIIGMYSFGEITPLSKGSNVNTIHLQNGSITIIAIE